MKYTALIYRDGTIGKVITQDEFEDLRLSNRLTDSLLCAIAPVIADNITEAYKQLKKNLTELCSKDLSDDLL